MTSSIVFVYLIVPFAVSAVLIRWLRRRSPDVPEDIRALYGRRPIEPKWFRVIKSSADGKEYLGDYETREEAVDRAYEAKDKARAVKEKAAFLVLDDKGESLEEVDS